MAIPLILKRAGRVGRGGILVLVLVPGLVLGPIWMAAASIAVLVLSAPFVARALARPLSATRSAASVGIDGVEALVVLDGDNRIGRVRQAAQTYVALGPRKVMVMGQAWLLEALTRAGIPASRLVLEPGPLTTHDQINWLRDVLPATPAAGRAVLVASRLQMRRVSGLARAVGLDLTLVPSPIDAEPPSTGFMRFVPTYLAFRVSRDALYEYAACFYYRRRGWLPFR